MNIAPLNERILLKQVKLTEERTKSGLYLPKSKDEKKEGEVIAVGTTREIIEFKDIVAKVEA